MYFEDSKKRKVYMELYVKAAYIDEHQNVQYSGIYAKLSDNVSYKADTEDSAFHIAKMALPDKAVLLASFITKKEFNQDFMQISRDENS